MQTKKFDYPRVLISKIGNKYNSIWKGPRRFFRHRQTTVIGPSWAALRKVTRITWEHRTNLFRNPLFHANPSSIFSFYSVDSSYSLAEGALVACFKVAAIHSLSAQTQQQNQQQTERQYHEFTKDKKKKTVTCADTVANALNIKIRQTLYCR